MCVFTAKSSEDCGAVGAMRIPSDSDVEGCYKKLPTDLDKKHCRPDWFAMKNEDGEKPANE